MKLTIAIGVALVPDSGESSKSVFYCVVALLYKQCVGHNGVQHVGRCSGVGHFRVLHRPVRLLFVMCCFVS